MMGRPPVWDRMEFLWKGGNQTRAPRVETKTTGVTKDLSYSSILDGSITHQYWSYCFVIMSETSTGTLRLKNVSWEDIWLNFKQRHKGPKANAHQEPQESHEAPHEDGPDTVGSNRGTLFLIFGNSGQHDKGHDESEPEPWACSALSRGVCRTTGLLAIYSYYTTIHMTIKGHTL